MELGILGGNAAVIKEHNRALVLDLIVRKGPLSRSQLAEEVQLTKTAITDIVNELVRHGLVRQVGEGSSNGGRRPILLDLNSGAYRIIVADLSGPTVRVALSDLRANLSESHYVTRRLRLADQFTVTDLLIMINEVLKGTKGASDDARPLLGIGVAVPGLLDYETGTVISAVQLGWSNVPLKAKLEKHFKLPVFVEREINAALLGEQWFGDARQLDDMLYVTLGTGVGVSMMLKGALYRGHNRLAGEFGHTVIQNDGPLCKCGSRGCLESLASMTAITERVKKEFLLGEVDAKLETIIRESGGQVDLDSVFTAAMQGSASAKQAVEEAGRFLGMGLANLVNLFDPEALFIGGSIPAAPGYEAYLNVARRAMEERILHGKQRRPKLVVSRFNERARLVGATALVLTEVLRSVGDVAPSRFQAARG